MDVRLLTSSTSGTLSFSSDLQDKLSGPNLLLQIVYRNLMAHLGTSDSDPDFGTDFHTVIGSKEDDSAVFLVLSAAIEKVKTVLLQYNSQVSSDDEKLSDIEITDFVYDNDTNTYSIGIRIYTQSGNTATAYIGA